MAANVNPDVEPFGPFTVAEVENCFKAFDLDNNGFVGAGELAKLRVINLCNYYSDIIYYILYIV